ncbi:MAG: chloride channel protein [Candidatus Rokuibacteriota bacterium]
MKTPEAPPLAWWSMGALAVAVGVIAGCGAVVFRAMISGFHNLLFLGQLSLAYDANLHTPPGPWGALVILVPVVGAMGVAFMVGTFAPEAKGHGVPEVMDSIYYREGRIRPVVVVVKSIASALSIGSGGSVGREGPIVQIGAAFGSTLGQIVRMPVRQRIVLVAAGAGAGIAATFNSPLGGMAFAVELMLPAISARSILHVALSTVVATHIGRYFFGWSPSFDVPDLALFRAIDLPLAVMPYFVICGIVVGLLATVMTRAIYWFEDRFEAMPGTYYTRHGLGMLAVGLILCGFLTLSSPLLGQPAHYYVEGVGYATILDILRGDLQAPGFLLLLVGAKLLVTCLTLGSGASGGIFSPSLYLGAALGAAVGSLLNGLTPGLTISPVHFALAGMAGMVAGTTGAVLTATIMLFEMTWNYSVIVPVIITATVAYALRQHLSPASLYTLKLLRRGDVVPQGLQGWILGTRRAQDVMSQNFVVANTTNQSVTSEVAVVARESRIAGVSLTDGSTPPYVLVEPGDPLVSVLRAMEEHQARVALVVPARAAAEPSEVLGVITDREVASLARATARLME